MSCREGEKQTYSVSWFSFSLVQAPLDSSYSACKEDMLNKFTFMVKYGYSSMTCQILLNSKRATPIFFTYYENLHIWKF